MRSKIKPATAVTIAMAVSLLLATPFAWSASAAPTAKQKRTESLTLQPPALAPASQSAGALPSPSNTLRALPSVGSAILPANQAQVGVVGATPVPLMSNPNMGLGIQTVLPYLMQLFSGQGANTNPFSGIPAAQTDFGNYGYEELDLAKDTMKRIGEIQTAVKNTGVPAEYTNAPALPGCTECSRAANTNPRFEQCQASNGYFEDFLASTNNPKIKVLQDHEPAASTVACVAESIRETSGDRYVYCPQGNRPYLGSVTKPCASEKLVKTVASAFEMTTECLADYVDAGLGNSQEQKEDFRRSMYQLINHESRFVVNGKSHTGAGGLGQLVGGLISDVNRREFSQMQNHIKGSKNSACQKLAQDNYEPMNGGRPEVAGCDRMALEKGPQLNLMYTLAHMKMIRDQIRGTLESTGIEEPAKSQLMNQVAVWGHNVGSGGIAQSFQLAVRRNGHLLKGSNANVNEFLRLMLQDVNAWHRQNSRRDPKEPSYFLYKTHSDLARIEKRTNGKCGSLN